MADAGKASKAVVKRLIEDIKYFSQAVNHKVIK